MAPEIPTGRHEVVMLPPALLNVLGLVVAMWARSPQRRASRRWRGARWCAVVACSIVVGARGVAAVEPFPGTVPGAEIGAGLSASFEPSGGAWHVRLNQLFVCGDDGAIARMNRDGSATTNWRLGGNWEGIAVADPATDLVYVVNENTGHIREFDFVAGAGRRDFDLTAATPGPGIPALTAADVEALVDSGDSRGAEALAFVPDSGDPEGGLFYVGSQENGYIYMFRLSLTAGPDATYMGKIRTWPSSNTDLSGLEYDAIHGVLLAAWDGSNVLRALTPAGEILHEWSMPAGSNDEEGLGFDGLSLFIAEDPAPASEVWRYDDFEPMSQLSIDDTWLTEGSAGSIDASFTVTLTPPCLQPVTVDWASVDATATAPGDYDAVAGTLSFDPGETTATVIVPVNGDLVDELDEAFLVELSSPTGAVVTDGEATGTILDDDPRLDPAGACDGTGSNEYCVHYTGSAYQTSAGGTTLHWLHNLCADGAFGDPCFATGGGVSELAHLALVVGVSISEPNGSPAVTRVWLDDGDHTWRDDGSDQALSIVTSVSTDQDEARRVEAWAITSTALEAFLGSPIAPGTVVEVDVELDRGAAVIAGSVSATGVSPTLDFRTGYGSTSSDQSEVSITSVPSTALIVDTIAAPASAADANQASPQVNRWKATAGDLIAGGSIRYGVGDTFTRWNLDVSSLWAAVAVGLLPYNATVVSFEDVVAVGYEKGGVRLAWTTGREVDNLGFRVYREQGDGPRVDVTRGLIAGTALLAPSRLQAGHAYAWIDPEGSSLSRYFIEDVDVHGSNRFYGPVAPEPGVGELPNEVRSRLLAQLDELRSGELRGASVVDHRGDAPTDLGVQRALAASADAIRIGIREEGWYRISQPNLVAAGLDPAAAPASLKLFVDGNEVAIRVTGAADGSFDPADAVELYATGVDTPVTDTRVYWLTASSGLGARIATAPAARVRNLVRTLPHILEFEQNLVYYAALNNGDAENIFGPLVAATPTELVLQVPAVDERVPSSATLEVALQGVQGSHDVMVELNGLDVGCLQFSGQEHHVAVLAVPPSALVSGANTVRLSPAPDDDISLVDSIRVSYPRRTIAVDDELRLSVPSSVDGFRIDGFTARTIEVADITDPNALQVVSTRLVGERTAGPGSFGPRTMYGVALGFPTMEARELYAFSSMVVKTPAWVERNRASCWYQASNAADLVVITHPDLEGAVAPLIDYRRSQGYTVAVVDVTDIYDEFSAGVKDPVAIRDFVQAAMVSWQQPPSYLLLVGDASYDPRNYLGLTERDLLPTKFVATEEFEAASEVWFADVDGDGVPDVHVGRLPAQNVGEVTAIVAKIVQWEQSPRVWSRVLTVSDEDDGRAFELSTEQLIDSLPAGTTIDDVRVADVGATVARGLVIDGIAAAPQVVSYVGHGAVQRWAHGVLTAADAPSLGNESHPALFAMMSCLTSYFQSAAQDSLAEALLHAPDRGAVAVWGSTAITGWAAQEPLMLEFYERLLDDPGVTTLGQAATAALAAADGDVRRTWVVLGDPLLSLR